MLLEELVVIQNLTPRWGRGHYLAKNAGGELLEVLVAECALADLADLPDLTLVAGRWVDLQRLIALNAAHP